MWLVVAVVGAGAWGMTMWDIETRFLEEGVKAQFVGNIIYAETELNKAGQE